MQFSSEEVVDNCRRAFVFKTRQQTCVPRQTFILVTHNLYVKKVQAF